MTTDMAAPPKGGELLLGYITGRKERHGEEFRLPIDLVARKTAIIGQSGCGKTCAVAKIEEELCRVGQAFTVLDTVGVHLGLRAKKDGRPSGLPVIIFGGKRGDLPINETEVGFGARLAEIVLASKIPIVIDLSKTYPKVRFRIVAEFAFTLMMNESPDARQIYVEESPEFIPQKLEFPGQDRAKAELGRLVTLGRNNGYAVTLVGQRWATIEKTCLAQVENFIIMRTNVKADRIRLKEIFDEVCPDADVREIFASMSKLEDGEAWFFSPQWLKRLERIRFHERETFHPGETRKVGVKLTQVDMGDVHKFVSELSKLLTKTAALAPKPQEPVEGSEKPVRGLNKALKGLHRESRPAQAGADPKEIAKLQAANTKLVLSEEGLRNENGRLKGEVNTLKATIKTNAEKVVGAREALKPLYESLRSLFTETEATVAAGSEMITDMEEYQAFFRSAGKYSAKTMLEIMIQRKRIKKSQLKTLCHLRTTSFYTAVRWMTRNRLMGEDGEYFVLLPL